MSSVVFTDVVLFLILPVLVVLLIGGWLLYAARGKRKVRFNLQGFGITLSVESAEKGSTTQRVEDI